MDLAEQTERMQSYYGLKHDPFGALVDTLLFSGAGGRYETAETIRHLLAYSQQDSLLTGPAGIGKRELATQVIKLLEPHWCVAWIDGASVQTQSDLLQELIGQLGLGLKLNDIESIEVTSILRAIAKRTEDDEAFLVVVQHADQLPTQLLAVLIELRTKAMQIPDRLRQIWLLENEQTVKQWTNDDDWYVHQIQPLTEDSAYQYLKDRFVAAGYMDAFPIDPKDVARLNELASGLPLELNHIARDYLISSTFQTTESKRSFPITHVAAGVAALTLVAIAILYQATEQKSESEIPERLIESQQLPISTVEQKLAEAVAKVEAKQSNNEQTIEVTEPLPIAKTPELEPAQDSVGSDEQKPVVKPVESPIQVATATNVMLKSAPDGDYTLQLIGVRDRNKLNAMMQQFPEDAPVEVVETTYKGSPWFVLIYGQFPDKPKAQSAASELPESLGVSEPWARTFKSIRSSQ